MVDIIIIGINSSLGQSVYKCANEQKITVLSGVDNSSVFGEFICPVYNSIDQVRDDADVIVCFDKSALYSVIPYAIKNKCPLVLGDTVLNEEYMQLVLDSSRKIPIFLSTNFSIAVNLIAEFATTTAKQFDFYDVEIIDMQSSNKVDAPSGTAKLLADTIQEARGSKDKIINGRKGQGVRNNNEIAIHSVRGGNIIGSHKILFIGPDETIAFEHVAGSRDLYAKGVLKACEYIYKKPNGLYTMKDYLKDKIKNS